MAAPFEGMNGDARPGSDEIEADAPWIGDGDGDPNNRRVEEKSREGRRRLEENFDDGVKIKGIVLRGSYLTVSFQSKTHFSIQGTKLITTNSRVKRAVCLISFSSILKVFNTVGNVGLVGSFKSGFNGLATDASGDGCGGRRGMSAGTGTGGGGVAGRFRGSR